MRAIERSFSEGKALLRGRLLVRSTLVGGIGRDAATLVDGIRSRINVRLRMNG